MKDKRVFISGGAGVIGNEMVLKLHQMGAKVFVGDLKPRPTHWPKDILYRQGDLNCLTEREINSFKPEIFFHLAATFERSTESYEFWKENFQHNINLSNHLMTVMKNITSLRRVVFASSYLIYNPELYNFPTPQKSAKRLSEGDPIYPRNLTGVAKLLHEIELRFLNGFIEVPFTSVCARIFRGYGKNSKDVISRWVRSLLNGEEITVYKKEGMFDYIYCEDTAEGLIKLALNYEVKGLINLGNDNARRVEEVVDILKKHFPEMKTKESDLDIPFEASQANMDYYVKTIGWKPPHQLEDTIPKIIEFEKNKSQQKDKPKPGNILITSVSRKVPLVKAVKMAAKKVTDSIKIIGGDVNENCIAKFFVDDFWLMPFIKDLNTEKVIEYCKTNNIKLIIPTRDGELTFFSSISNDLEKSGIYVLISNPEQIEVCLDKNLFYEFCNGKSINAIKTSLKIEDIQSEKFVVKERFGAGSISIGIDLTKEEAIQHSKNLSNPIYQPFIKGNEISVDAYIDKKGNVKGVLLRRRDMVVNGESQITTSFKSDELEKLFSDIIFKLNLRGHIVLQAIIDDKNNVHLIECNSRFGGASTLSIAAGLDSFYWAILESSGEDISEYSYFRSETEVKQIRYPNDYIIDDSGI